MYSYTIYNIKLLSVLLTVLVSGCHNKLIDKKDQKKEKVQRERKKELRKLIVEKKMEIARRKSWREY